MFHTIKVAVYFFHLQGNLYPSSICEQKTTVETIRLYADQSICIWLFIFFTRSYYHF